MSYGLKIINIGNSADSGTGDSARAGAIKINTNFVDIYSQFGDLPIDLNPNSPTYGTRAGVEDLNLITPNSPAAFLHPAGYWQRVQAGNPGELRVDGSDKNIFPVSRGEQIIIDFELLNADTSFNVYLPIARKGDVIKIRDSFNTLTSGKKLKIWATPIIYRGGDISTWKYGERTPIAGDGSPRAPSPNHVKINGISRSYMSYTKVDSNDPNYSIPETDSSQELIFNTPGLNIELVYGGDEIGWTLYKIDPFNASYDLNGRELFGVPLFNSANTSSADNVRIIYSPIIESDPELISPEVDPLGTYPDAYWVGGSGACNTIFFDDQLLSEGSGNSFILYNVATNNAPVASPEFRPWEIYLSYPESQLEEENYIGRTITIVNKSQEQFTIRPMWATRDAEPKAGKDGNITVNYNGEGTDLENYNFVEGVYDSDITNANDMFIEFEPDVVKVKLVYSDRGIYQSNENRGGWTIIEIENKNGITSNVREFQIVSDSSSVETLPRYESELDVTPLSVDDPRYGKTVSGKKVIQNIVTGIKSLDPLFNNSSAKIQAIDLEIQINGTTMIQGDRNNGDYYPFICPENPGSPTSIFMTNPPDYASTPRANQRYSLFNAIHFATPLEASDYVRIKWKSITDLDAVQSAAIADMVNSQLETIGHSIGKVKMTGTGVVIGGSGFGNLFQGDEEVPINNLTSPAGKNIVLQSTDWDQGEY